MKLLRSNLFKGLLILFAAFVCRSYLIRFIEPNYTATTRLTTGLFIIFIGAFYVIRSTAKIIESTTEVLSHRTRLAGGLLQSLGTAFPDMILGISAALISLRFVEKDYRGKWD